MHKPVLPGHTEDGQKKRVISRDGEQTIHIFCQVCRRRRSGVTRKRRIGNDPPVHKRKTAEDKSCALKDSFKYYTVG